MTRRVVFAGGIQTKALARAYRLEVAGERDEDVFFIGADAVSREAAHRVIAAADIVVTDVTEAGEAVPERLVPASAQRIVVPVVSGAFLWPYAGRAHPQNRSTDALPGGPYPADFGDGFLDSMLAEGVPADEALRRYLAFDVAGTVDLDALLDDTLSRQAQLDARTGFGLAQFIGANFRTLNLFATRDRLRLPLFQHLAAAVFDRMGVGAGPAQALSEAPFAPGAMPIHPAVLRHFALAVPQPDHRYPVLDEGLFTFEQYCRRYMRAEWNEALHAAIALAENDPAAALPALRAALEVSPGSRAGCQALEDAERAVAERSSGPLLALPASRAEPAGDALYAAADAALPAEANVALTPPMPRELHHPPHADTPLADGHTGEAVFADGSIAGLHYAPLQTPGLAALAEPGLTPQSGPESGPVSGPEPHTPTPPATVEQQSYVELPSTYNGLAEAVPVPVAETPSRYVPLAPSTELIEVLPRMLPSSLGLASSADSPFATMPEIMPPPPLRPVLPPELQPEPRRGLIAKLFGGR